MVMERWNADKKMFEEYVVSDEWEVAVLSSDMEKVVNCASCGAEIPWKVAYASMEIRGPIGLGYGICERCHDEELARAGEVISDD